MKCTRLCRGIYYFENVFSPKMHETVYGTCLHGNFKLDFRPGSTHNVEGLNQIFYGLMLQKREEFLNYFYHDDESAREMFSYDTDSLDKLDVLAKGPQHEEYSHYHTDNDIGDLQMGIIYYPHKVWDDEWGGELKIGKTINVFPNPNSAIMFPSHIPHAICPVKINAESWRLTVFMKTTNTNENRHLHKDFMLRVSEGAYDEKLIEPKKIVNHWSQE